MARRAHSRAELRAKLARRRYPQAEVESALGRLAELGYLDDRSFAAGHVGRRASRRGPRALAAELAARGVERSVAGEAVARFGPEAQLESASRLVRAMAGHRLFAGYEQLLGSIGPKLVRRGFSPSIARAACRLAWESTEFLAPGPAT